MDYIIITFEQVLKLSAIEVNLGVLHASKGSQQWRQAGELCDACDSVIFH